MHDDLAAQENEARRKRAAESFQSIVSETTKGFQRLTEEAIAQVRKLVHGDGVSLGAGQEIRSFVEQLGSVSECAKKTIENYGSQQVDNAALVAELKSGRRYIKGLSWSIIGLCVSIGTILTLESFIFWSPASKPESESTWDRFVQRDRQEQKR